MSALTLRRGPCHCGKSGCAVTWPRDPVLEVPCPGCLAPIGSGCRRPSGHGGGFVEIHASRDLAADAAGAYGTCPLGLCGAGVIAAIGRANGTTRAAAVDINQLRLFG